MSTIPATPVASHLVLVLHANELAAWQASPGGKPKALPIKGEQRLAVRNAQALESAHADIAERLRGPYRPPQYRKVMLPLIVLRRLDMMLEDSKAEVCAE